jgi:hypothetical protein
MSLLPWLSGLIVLTRIRFLGTLGGSGAAVAVLAPFFTFFFFAGVALGTLHFLKQQFNECNKYCKH